MKILSNVMKKVKYIIFEGNYFFIYKVLFCCFLIMDVEVFSFRGFDMFVIND